MPRSPITVAHLLPWRAVGGVEIATLRVAQASEGAVRNIAFCVPDAGPVEKLFSDAGFPVVTYLPPTPSYRHGARFLKESYALARLLRRECVTVLHCADLTSAPGGAVAGKMARAAVFCHVRNRYDVIEGREKPFLSPVDRFVFVSQDSWRRFDYPVKERRGTVLYDGFQPQEIANVPAATSSVREEFGIKPQELVIGMVARIAAQKDHETLLAAAAIVRQTFPHFRLLFVGDYEGADSYRQHYEKVRKIVAERDLDSVCIFTGHRSDAVRLMAAMDIFVLSTHQEGLPLVLLEAMAMERPVIATAVDGIPELLSESTGVLVPHQDAQSLADTILGFARDPDRRAALGARAAAHVRQRFSMEQFAANVRRLYRECG